MKSNFKLFSGALFFALTFTACAKKVSLEVSEEDIAAAEAAIAAIQAGATTEDIEDIVNGSGVTASDIVITGSDDGVGQFEGAGENIGIAQGFVLSTGNVEDLFQPASANISSSTSGASNDVELLAITTQSIYDASIVEFEVVPTGDTLQMPFVFGSEEYTQYACSSYNDAFGIFVSGPNPSGGNYSNVNIAKLPNGDVVSINNVNHGNDVGNGICGSSEYYTDNAGAASDYIAIDGMTEVLTASIDVTPGQEYHIKIGIADVADDRLDSAVFVGAAVSANGL